MGPVLFNVFIIDKEKGIECTLGRFAGDTKMSGAVAPLEGFDCHPEGPGLVQEVAHGNVMRFKKTEFKVLHLGQANPWY